MTVFTRSKFYYGHTVTSTSLTIDFSEGVDDFTAELRPGGYSLTDFATEVARAMNLEGNNTYSTSLDRTTRKITISADANFDLNVTAGPTAGISAFPLIGFTTDRSGASSYESDEGSGEEFKPMLQLQDFIDFDDSQAAASASVNQAGDGSVETFSFGKNKFMACNIQFQKNITLAKKGFLESDPNGKDNLRDFMEYAITKSPLEFMKDRDTPSSFTKCILERTPAQQNGTGFELQENRQARTFFDSGRLVFRARL